MQDTCPYCNHLLKKNCFGNRTGGCRNIACKNYWNKKGDNAIKVEELDNTEHRKTDCDKNTYKK